MKNLKKFSELELANSNKMADDKKEYLEYESVPADFYDNELKNANPLTRYYHDNRYEKIRKFISARYKNGNRILDIGSGSSSWNTSKLPVTAVDVNEGMLNYGQEKGYIKDAIVHDLKSKLPLGDKSFDFAVISEVLEHLEDPAKEIGEAFRVLKEGGFLIITVPLDTPLSPWQVLFEIGCFIRGDLLGNQYFKNRCGHIQHFSVESISGILEKNGFVIVEKNIGLLNIGIIAQRSENRKVKRR
ncbi:class I SAM-dependent methyltransferase [Candidatus Micrarchaeota archaeon]|nr:class I SAM-dependent methyltransferase [Candidatus Micrarchaeota archaeon]